jgi:hypothetical protein
MYISSVILCLRDELKEDKLKFTFLSYEGKVSRESEWKKENKEDEEECKSRDGRE